MSMKHDLFLESHLIILTNEMYNENYRFSELYNIMESFYIFADKQHNTVFVYKYEIKNLNKNYINPFDTSCFLTSMVRIKQ